jgi:hypothetical protein
LRLLDVPEYLDEIAAVRIVETTAGKLKLENARGRFDDMTQATAMCVAHLLDRPPSRRGRVSSVAGRSVREAGGWGSVRGAGDYSGLPAREYRGPGRG